MKIAIEFECSMDEMYPISDILLEIVKEINKEVNFIKNKKEDIKNGKQTNKR